VLPKKFEACLSDHAQSRFEPTSSGSQIKLANDCVVSSNVLFFCYQSITATHVYQAFQGLEAEYKDKQ